MKISPHYILILLYLSITVFAGQRNRYSKVKIYFNTKDQITNLAKEGLIFDHVQIQKEADRRFSYTAIVDQNELAILTKSPLEYEIVTGDVVEAYKKRLQSESFNKSALNQEDPLRGFELGSLGGFYTFNEMVTELDSMHMLYPDLITAKDSIGCTHEGRAIWMVKISDNPNVDEDEPEILYDAMLHAREPGGMMTLMYFMYYLLENYGSNPEVTYLVNNRELYFVPIINPDGYEYNREMEPNGGYLWRKNKRDNNIDNLFTENIDGVDLNRNFGEFWGYDNIGSSPDTGSSAYRGPEPFSEPEIQAITNLCIKRNFKIALNYHTFSNLLIYPWGYIPSYETPDSNIFRQLAHDMTQYNNYSYGTANQTVRYTVNGYSDDWMYGEQLIKNKIFAMTPEVGSSQDGFWPDPSKIYPMVQENVYSNLFAARAAGGQIQFVDYNLHDTDGLDYIITGKSNLLTFVLKNTGLDVSENFTIHLSTTDSLVTVSDQTLFINGLSPRDTIISDPLTFTVDPSTKAGFIPNINLEINQNGLTTIQPIKGLITGKPRVLFADDFEITNKNWIAEDSWTITNEKHHSGLYSFSDSPFGKYDNNLNSSLVLAKPVSLVDVNAARLEFWMRWDIEAKYDFAQAQVSTDSVNWISLEGQFTKGGSGLGKQPLGSFGYDGVHTQWVKEKINLNQYINQGPLYIRFNIQSDNFVTGDGWYIDDVQFITYQDSVLTSFKENFQTSHKFMLYQNYPNPFNPTTYIRFDLAKSANLEIKIYDVTGREIRTLVQERKPAGQYTLIWNGRNDSGLPVSSGVYFYVMKSGKFLSRKKLILLR